MYISTQVSLRRGILVLDVVLPAVTGPLGLVCCQGVGAVLVDTVVPMSPAYRADLRRDDVVLAIDNKPVNNVAQVFNLYYSIMRYFAFNVYPQVLYKMYVRVHMYVFSDI